MQRLLLAPVGLTIELSIEHQLERRIVLRKILIVEDTPTIARVQKHICLQAGYEVDIADSKAKAEALIAKNNYFCAIVDFILPDAPQGEAIPCSTKAKIPTIVMTGSLESKTREIVDRHPIIDYITKENKQAYQYLKRQLERLPRNEKIKILVVDDSATSRNYVSGLLKRHKYQVLEARDGLEALAMLERYNDISVIVTDSEMPKMRGEELCIEIRRIYTEEDIAIIGISGVESAHLSARFLKNGANDYLRKPFNPEEFYCRVRQNVEMLEQIRTIRRQANSDYLTELPNRRYFFSQVNKSLKAAAQQQQPSMIAMLDVDHFKAVNDRYGHDGGDEVLKALSKALCEHFDYEQVARMGGEEFAVYFAAEDPQHCLQKLEAFRRFVHTQGAALTPQSIAFTVSVGAAYGISDNIEALIKAADVQLYHAKDSGRNTVAYAPLNTDS
nr:diguanylate cyclase [Pseudoalteromonas sp. CNAT2-18.1]